MSILAAVNEPDDLRHLSSAELDALALEIRRMLIESVSATGGHLGPNLGVVEITIALHRIFHSPEDAFIWDVGHQSYPHKLLTGRKDFSRLRCAGGMSGYPERSESEHDIVENSHASVALSWADGLSRARALSCSTADASPSAGTAPEGKEDPGKEDPGYVVVVVGDGALTGGMCWEALNNITDDNRRRLIVVLNDNGRSYAPTIGGFARFLNVVGNRRSYRWLKRSTRNLFYGVGLRRLYDSVSEGVHGFFNRFISADKLFSNLNIHYLGPVNGHDRKALEEAFQQAKNHGRPVIVHAITRKGQGYTPAEQDQLDHFHAVGKIDQATGRPAQKSSSRSWTDIFGAEILRLAEENPRIIAITAAMLQPTGLGPLAKKYPQRVIDVGIAEQHAVASSAGWAYGGYHPVVAIYSTFINRAFDQLLMDVALHRAGVTFVLDRAGITGPDGPSHHGMWDLSLLQVVPGIRIAAPRDSVTLRESLRTAVTVEDRPTVIRFPRGSAPADLPPLRTLTDGVQILFSGDGSSAARGTTSDDVPEILLVAVGAMAHTCLEVARRLVAAGEKVTVADPVWVVPVPESLVSLSASARMVVTVEDGVKVGGVGGLLRQSLRASTLSTPVVELGIPARFQPQGTREEVLSGAGLDVEGILSSIRRFAATVGVASAPGSKALSAEGPYSAHPLTGVIPTLMPLAPAELKNMAKEQPSPKI